MQQITLRHMKGVSKKQLLLHSWPPFHEKRKKEREERMREHAKLRRDDKEVPETSDKETIEEEKTGNVSLRYFLWHIHMQLGKFESDRFKVHLQKIGGLSFFTMDDLMENLRAMYDEDRNVLVSETFERIILGDTDLSCRTVIEGLGVQEAAHVCPVKK